MSVITDAITSLEAFEAETSQIGGDLESAWNEPSSWITNHAFLDMDMDVEANQQADELPSLSAPLALRAASILQSPSPVAPQLIDDGERANNFGCSQCKKEYSSDYSLKRHIKTHTALRKQCACGRSFATAETLKRHEKRGCKKVSPDSFDFLPLLTYIYFVFQPSFPSSSSPPSASPAAPFPPISAPLFSASPSAPTSAPLFSPSPSAPTSPSAASPSAALSASPVAPSGKRAQSNNENENENLRSELRNFSTWLARPSITNSNGGSSSGRQPTSVSKMIGGDVSFLCFLFD
jgi:hypothetical protein